MGRLTDLAGRTVRGKSWGVRVAARLGAGYIRLVNSTTRWQVIGRDSYRTLLAEGPGVIAVGWHGRLFMAPLWVPVGAQARPTVAMISNNRDGTLIAALVRRFSVEAVRGSTYDRAKRRDKGGGQAYQQAVQALIEQHALVAITPDGPRGPRMRAQLGAARLAIETGTKIQPISFSARWAKGLRSWDRFLVPFPFGRGVQIYGDVLVPPADQDDASVAGFARAIEDELTRITNQADSLCGRTPVAPGPPLA